MPVEFSLRPDRNKSRIPIPDSTPELLRAYAVSDRQMQFAFVRHNSVLQLFCGIMCWHLQNNVLVTVPATKTNSVVMDELYIGLDSYGHHRAVLLIAFKDAVANAGQLRRASKYLRNHFPRALHDIIALEPIAKNAFALFSLKAKGETVLIVYERQFELVQAADMSI